MKDGLQDLIKTIGEMLVREACVCCHVTKCPEGFQNSQHHGQGSFYWAANEDCSLAANCPIFSRQWVSFPPGPHQTIWGNRKLRNSTTADGVLAPGSAHARPSALPPIDTSGNFPAHMSAHLPQPLRSHIRSFGTLGQLLIYLPWPPKYMIVRGVGGSPNTFFWLEPFYFC